MCGPISINTNSIRKQQGDKEHQLMNKENQLSEAIEVALDKKAQDAVVLELGDICSFTDYFLMCTGTSTRHNQTTMPDDSEAGTGKVALALWLHYNSPRKHGPFITIDLTDLPERFVEQELFGYEEDTFTKLGRLDLARHGTIVMDGISIIDS